MPTIKEIEKLSGEWVLLFEDKIIDHSANIEDMLLAAEKQYPKDQYHQNKVIIKKVFQGSPREKLIDK